MTVHPPRSRSATLVLVIATCLAAMAPPFGSVPTAEARAGVLLRSHGPRTDRVVAFTIDDCFRPEAVAGMLEVLTWYRVNATFFPTGRAVTAYPDQFRAVADAGFPIANHTRTHADLTRMSAEEIVADIRSAASIIRRVTKVRAAPILRPPIGAWDANVVRAAGAAGIRAVVLWDVTFGDTGRGSIDDFVRRASRAEPGSIILLHANRLPSVEALERAIEALRARGFGFVTVSALLGLDATMPYPAFAGPSIRPSSLDARPSLRWRFAAD